MTQTNNEREALLDKLLAEYWDIAYSEGNSGLWHGKKAQSTLNDIRKLFKTQSTISQNEQQESVTNLWEALGKWSAYLASNGEQANLAPPSWLIDAVSSATSPPKQIPDGWKLIGKVSEMGVVWHKQNPHAHPIGTEFYAVLPTTSETNTEVWE